MSMDLGGAKGGVKSDINVTPLVDVMLVLLIIMMLVAPMLQQGCRSPCRTREHDRKARYGRSDRHRRRRRRRIYSTRSRSPRIRSWPSVKTAFEEKGREDRLPPG